MRVRSLVVVIALMAAACGGNVAPTTTTDPRLEAASEFAFSARRALEDTRFASLGDEAVAGLILDLCDRLVDSSDPDGSALETVVAIDAPAGDPIDDEIMAVVLAEGALAVCPEAVDEAAARAFLGAPPEEQFLAAVVAVAPVLETDPSDDALVEAGFLVCEVLDAGGSPEEAVIAEFSALFGVVGASIDEIAAGEAGEREGLLAGAVLGSAAAFLCPQHRSAVTTFLEELAEESAE